MKVPSNIIVPHTYNKQQVSDNTSHCHIIESEREQTWLSITKGDNWSLYIEKKVIAFCESCNLYFSKNWFSVKAAYSVTMNIFRTKKSF